MLALLASLLHAAPPPAPPAPAPTPRERGAYGSLLYLRSYSRQMITMDGRGQFTRDGCPTDVAWVTFGMAKTDAWNSGFKLACTTTPELGSAGADRAWGTPDDLWTDRPLVAPATACASVCARANACGDTGDLCARACAAADPEQAFYADTCALLPRCVDVAVCVDTALRGHAPVAPCSELGRLGAGLVGRPPVAGRLTAECDQDLLRAHELVCAAASTTPRDFALCVLTVNRARVEEILAQ